jgi:hypothetical protein
MTPELTTIPTPRAMGWRPSARGRRSGRPASWMGQSASGKPQPGSRRVALRLRPAGAGALRMATHRGVFPRPCVPGRAACSGQAGRRRRGAFAGERSTAVDRSRRTHTLPVLPRRPRRRLTDAVLRPPWWPPRPRPRAGSPLVRPAGCIRRPTGGGRGHVLPCFQGPGEGKGRMCRIRSRICVRLRSTLVCPHGVLSQEDMALIWQMRAAISPTSDEERR